MQNLRTIHTFWFVRLGERGVQECSLEIEDVLRGVEGGDGEYWRPEAGLQIFWNYQPPSVL